MKKKVIFILSLFFAVQSQAQDSSKLIRKEWLGVLTLTEKYTVEKNWTDKTQSIVGEHFQRLVKMKDSGIVVLAGRMNLPLNNPEMKGLIIFYSANKEEALQFMNNDPAVKNKIMNAQVYPYNIAVIKCSK